MNRALSLAATFDAALTSLPLVAILRGITPDEIDAIGAVLHAAGFRLIEVPLNSPSPFESIARLRRKLPADTLVGAGTVLLPDQIDQLRATGAALAVMPHADPDLIRTAKAAGLLCLPGVSTPTEAFGALRAGADALKLFPAELLTPPGAQGAARGAAARHPAAAGGRHHSGEHGRLHRSGRQRLRTGLGTLRAWHASGRGGAACATLRRRLAQQLSPRLLVLEGPCTQQATLRHIVQAGGDTPPIRQASRVSTTSCRPISSTAHLPGAACPQLSGVPPSVATSSPSGARTSVTGTGLCCSIAIATEPVPLPTPRAPITTASQP